MICLIRKTYDIYKVYSIYCLIHYTFDIMFFLHMMLYIYICMISDTYIYIYIYIHVNEI